MTDSARSADPLNTLYREHHGWLQGWLRRRLGDSHTAADLAQDTFVRLLGNRSAGFGDEPRALLRHIAGNLLIDHWRRREVERAYLEALAHWSEPQAPSPETRLLITASSTRRSRSRPASASIRSVVICTRRWSPASSRSDRHEPHAHRCPRRHRGGGLAHPPAGRRTRCSGPSGAAGVYTHATNEYTRDADASRVGTPFNRSLPRDQFKLSTSYSLPGALRRWRVGGNVYVQDSVNGTWDDRIEQKGYAIVGLQAGYRPAEQIDLRLVVNNLFDKYYYTGVG